MPDVRVQVGGGMLMGDTTAEQLAAFNRIYREMDEIYHLYAKAHDISDTVLWLLYSLYERPAAYTQRELCDTLHYPPQTVNSALKTLEKRGAIELRAIPRNRKNKIVALTKQGQSLVQKIIAPLFAAEQCTFRGLSGEESERLLSLSQKYVALLRGEVQTIS